VQAFIALEPWASHAASYPVHLITLSRVAWWRSQLPQLSFSCHERPSCFKILQSLNFPLYSAFVPTAEDMKLGPRAFHRKMCSGREVAGHAGFYVMVQYSVSQLCSELQKLESWSAVAP